MRPCENVGRGELVGELIKHTNDKISVIKEFGLIWNHQNLPTFWLSLFLKKSFFSLSLGSADPPDPSNWCHWGHSGCRW